MAERQPKVFNELMDTLAIAQRPTRNSIITEWLAVLDRKDQDRLLQKLESRGIKFIPQETVRYNQD